MDIIDQFFNNIPTFLYTPLFIIKVISGVVSLFFLVVIIYSLARSNYLRMIFWQDFFEFFTFKMYGAKKIAKRWEGISKRLTTASESEYKLAVIEAESVLEEILIRMGLSGQSFGERIKRIQKAQLPSLDDVLQAHQMRNNVVHDPDYKLTLQETKKAIDVYERALKELDAL